MKNIVSLLSFILVFTFAASAQQATLTPTTGAAMAKAKWEKTDFAFGKIVRNKPVTAEFKVKNSGTSPLVITNAKGSCGCTVAEYTQEPIMPGKTGFVKATFNAAALGSFNKTVTITTNTEVGNETLSITGEVVEIL